MHYYEPRECGAGEGGRDLRHTAGFGNPPARIGAFKEFAGRLVAAGRVHQYQLEAEQARQAVSDGGDSRRAVRSVDSDHDA